VIEMTNFGHKLKELLIKEGVIEELWNKSVEEAKEDLEEDWDLMETAKNAFQDLLVEFTYDWIEENIVDETAKALIEEGINDVDFEDIVNAIIIEKRLEV
jgi:hypothetical protein